mgnify:CR=1 FL=1|tara:strand:- start:26209 stop:27183 length:975 start_codon:yes stop_codon:yes gene_type:complete
MSNHILIVTKPDDEHAKCVHQALCERGHQSYLWQPQSFPVEQQQTFSFKDNNLVWSVKDKVFEWGEIDFDVVWLRRPKGPVLPENLHVGDIENVKHENLSFYKSLWPVIAPNARWVNHYYSAMAANSNIWQLKVAIEVGLEIPQTIFSNNPVDIKQFIARFHDQEVIYKTLYPHVWFEDKNLRLCYSKPISLDDLPSDVILQSMPGIFQTKIHKSYEIRVTYLGGKIIAVKLLSQIHAKGLDDWRSIPTNELSIALVQLPTKIEEKCRLLMTKLGLVFGCLDFIVSPKGEYYFLEVNEQGQFLWIKDIAPDIKMLDHFCDFILS